jgi:BirA family biotin operon repressor/biotin-[acetyl-CoA-carboxylase] ligase
MILVEHDLFGKSASTFPDHALMHLHSTAATAGYRLLKHETVASTNAEALALARGGERGPLWITARQQSAGRGRRGNAWISPPGNLYATLLLHDPAPAEHAPELSFVTALVLHDAIMECAPLLQSPLKLKWPNDLLVGGAKIAGILIESERMGEKLTVVIGIGVNCRHHPADTHFPATDLASAGADISAESLFAALSGTMVERLREWHRGAGFAAIRADWVARAAGIGGDMRIRLPDRELLGRGEALDEHGRLLLRLPDGSVQAIAAGEVFPLAVAPAGKSTTGPYG